MTLTFNRPATRNVGNTPPLAPVWLAAGAGMVVLAAAVSFWVPEESLTIMAGLLILLLALADLRVGFLTYVAIYPLMPLTWGLDMPDWMPYLSVHRLCSLALTGVFLFQSNEAWDTPRVKCIGRFLVALVALEILVGFASNDPMSAIKRAFGDVVEFYAPFIIASHLFRTKAQVRVLVITALISMAVVSVLAIIEHGLHYSPYDSFVSTRADINTLMTEKVAMFRGVGVSERRVRVAFFHSIALGLHLMCILLAALYLLRRSGMNARLLVLVGIPLYCLAMLYTFSRGPILGLLCGLAWLGMIGRGMRSLLLAMLLCSVGAYFLMPAKAREVMAQTVDTSTDIQTGVSAGGGTVRARLDLLQTGLQYSQGSLFFGHGPGEVRETQLKAADRTTVDFSMVDNYYLSVLLNYGVFVLVLTIAFFLYLLGLFTRAALRIEDRDIAVLAAIAAALCVANYVALTTTSIHFPLFWMLLGAALRMVEQHSPERRHGNSLRRRPHNEENHAMERWNRTVHPRGPLPAGGGGSTLAFLGCKVRVPRCRLSGLALPALLALVLAAAGPAHAAPSFYGTTGLFATPVAAVPPRGAWSVGSNYVGRSYRPGASSISKGTVANFFTLTLVHNLELTVVLTNYLGKLGAQQLNHGLSPDFNIGGLTLDRTASTQWLALPQHGDRPSLAFGMRDFLGRSVKHLRTQYGVLSLHRGRLTLAAGYGTLALGGPFGGVEYALTPQISLIGEGLTNQKNGGLRIVPLPDVQLDMALMGFHSLAGGLSYRRRF